MKLTKRQLRQIVNEEATSLFLKDTQNDAEDTDFLFQQETLRENWATSGVKAAVTDMIPGGRFVSDYTQAQEFDDIDNRLDSLEGTGDSSAKSIVNRLSDLEARFKDIEDALDAWLGKYN